MSKHYKDLSYSQYSLEPWAKLCHSQGGWPDDQESQSRSVWKMWAASEDASPCMYEALKELMDLIGPILGDVRDPERSKAEIEAGEKAYAALSKASPLGGNDE